MPRSGGTFSGDISFGGYNLRFPNPSRVERILSPTILEVSYSNYNTWLAVTPTSLPATTFSGDITYSTKIIVGSSTLTLPILEYVVSSYNSWIDGLNHATQKATTFTGDIPLGTNIIVFTNAATVSRTINQAMLEALYSGSICHES